MAHKTIAANEPVYVIVSGRPNKVCVGLCGELHTAKWRTADNGGKLHDVIGNNMLLNAALIASVRLAKDHFVMTAAELRDLTEGWVGFYIA